MKRIKVFHVVTSFELGGVESLVLKICNGIDHSKYEIHLLSLTNDRLKLINLLTDKVKVHSLNFTAKELRSIYGGIRCFFQLKYFLQKYKPDIIHSHLYFIQFFLVCLAIRYNRKGIISIRTLHTSGGFYSSKNLQNRLRLLIEIVATKLNTSYLICVSKSVLKNSSKFFVKHVKSTRLIYNGVELGAYSKSQNSCLSNVVDDVVKIVYVARMSDGKNHAYLLQQYKKIQSRFPNSILLLAGDGELLSELRQLSKKIGLDNKVCFLGDVDDIPKLLSNSDIAVFPSSFEGFSLVLLEKMASSLPVVTSDINAFREVIQHNISGFTIPLENENYFINTIVNLCEDKKLRQFIGANAKLRVNQYSIEKTILEHEKYYSDISI